MQQRESKGSLGSVGHRDLIANRANIIHWLDSRKWRSKVIIIRHLAKNSCCLGQASDGPHGPARLHRPRLPSSAPSRSILPITLLPNPLRYDGHKAMMLSFAYQRLASSTDTQPSSLAVFSSVSCPLSDSVIAQRSPAMQPRLVRDLEVLVTATAIYWLPLTQ